MAGAVVFVGAIEKSFSIISFQTMFNMTDFRAA
jgi:hypothetical protein